MMPIAMSVVRVLPGSASASPQQNFATALVLGVAYAASIGGMGTLIGSPTNGIAAAIIDRTLGIKVSFADWLAVGLPLVLMAIPLCWWLLTRWVFRVHSLGFDRAQVLAAIGEPGPWSLAERRLLPLLLATVCGWIALPWLKALPGLGALDDSMIGLIAALLLFVIPVEKKATTLLTWRDTDRAPWDLVILFGGGLALAEAITRTGLSTWIGGLFVQMQDVPVVVWILAVTALVILATEAASNVAAAASFVPIVVSAGVALGFADRGIDPLALVMPAAIAASWGFVMPAGTPPNAIAYSTGEVRVRQMLRAGVWIDLLGVLIIPAICWLAYVVLR
jgi:sodium-dependent dicarboxylate transporter 2/3/5